MKIPPCKSGGRVVNIGEFCPFGETAVFNGTSWYYDSQYGGYTHLRGDNLRAIKEEPIKKYPACEPGWRIAMPGDFCPRGETSIFNGEKWVYDSMFGGYTCNGYDEVCLRAIKTTATLIRTKMFDAMNILTRISGNELSELAQTMQWGTYGRDGDQPLRYIKYADLEPDHIRNILITQQLEPKQKAVLLHVLFEKLAH